MHICIDYIQGDYCMCEISILFQSVIPNSTHALYVVEAEVLGLNHLPALCFRQKAITWKMLNIIGCDTC